MKIYNNIVSVFLIVVLILLPFARVSATDITTNTYTSYAQTNYIEKKNALASLPNGEKYIQAIDALVEKIKNNPEKLKKVNKKVIAALSKLMYKYDLTKNEKRFLAILQYLSAKIDLIYDVIQQEKDRQAEMKYNVIMHSVENSDISETDQKKFNDSVVTIQKNIVKTYEEKTLALLDKFDTFYNYENKGDLDITLNIES
ncbi:MAG: hypothetical protein GY828_01105, partial [Candidatus Gracilibacteria bacterium]|nr:hypothetical protein [Candidatus Gracilibacteria bacterium]